MSLTLILNPNYNGDYYKNEGIARERLPSRFKDGESLTLRPKEENKGDYQNEGRA